MPRRRTKDQGGTENKQQLSREMRRKKLALFIQQFEKEAQDRLNDLESRMEDLLATTDKLFKVELMKMPPSLQNTLIRDLISEEEASASDASIAMKSESLEMTPPLRRNHSRRLKSADTPPVCSSSGQRSSTRNPKVVKGTRSTRNLVGSNSTGNLVGSSVMTKRAQTRLTSRQTAEQAVQKQTTPKLRSVMSAGDIFCSKGGAAAHISVTTAQGQMLSFSEETRDEINLDLLDDVAWCQIKKLSGLMEYLSRHHRIHQ
ncbi:PREDICTED: borealin-2-like [Cyprinodon variegatus]|uniref:borealin-2-like n=1 Tax=Cyprinodon variegatus TaxID=28743 RepID=UPI0007429CCD|nr:PREDICTED: borealin-2-like [Cyprinodon variegatus]